MAVKNEACVCVLLVSGVLADSSDRGEPVVIHELDAVVKTERHILWRRCQVLLSHHTGGWMDFLYTNWYQLHQYIVY